MKRQVVLLLTLTLCPLVAATLNQEERNFAMSNLHASRKMFLDSIAGLSEAQWKFKPAPDRWSIAECAEHIVVSEDVLFRMITEEVMKSPASPPRARPGMEQDEAILRQVTDRSQKATAPDSMKPTGRWPSREALIQHFKDSRERTIAYVENTEDDLRSHSQEEMDAYQWILLLSGHTERHVAQINEVKADPNFPKN